MAPTFAHLLNDLRVEPRCGRIQRPRPTGQGDEANGHAVRALSWLARIVGLRVHWRACVSVGCSVLCASAGLLALDIPVPEIISLPIGLRTYRALSGVGPEGAEVALCVRAVYFEHSRPEKWKCP